MSPLAIFVLIWIVSALLVWAWIVGATKRGKQ